MPSRNHHALVLFAVNAVTEGLLMRYAGILPMRHVGIRMGELWDGPHKYGRDPRTNQKIMASDISEVGAWSIAPSGNVHTLSNLAQLQAALAAPEFTVLKFVRKDCPACASTAQRFEAAAQTFKDHGRFYLVDFDDSKGFCRQCKIKAVPSAHLYFCGALTAAMPLGPASWDAMYERLVQEAREHTELCMVTA